MRHLIWISVLFLLACGKAKEDGDKPIFTGPPLTTSDVVMHYSDSAKKVLDLTTKLQIKYHKGDQEFPKGLFLEFYNNDEEIESTLIGDRGYYVHASGKWIITGNVVLNNIDKGDRIETDTLNWFPREHLIKTRDSVRITTGTQLLWGKGLEANEDFSEYEILDPSGVLDLEE